VTAATRDAAHNGAADVGQGPGAEPEARALTMVAPPPRGARRR
jgi:hypothetical protein